MAPIDLHNWKPKDTKPTTDWKARDAAELECFDVPFAIKELMQNIVGQALKDYKVREWDGFAREDLRNKTVDERKECKRRLVETYPSIFTGPHGIMLTHAGCLPLYVLSANSPVPAKPTNLAIAVVVWTTENMMNALTFFNNHLDDRASFDSFVVDGLSTSKFSTFAVGEKGKGFILAIQYLLEELDRTWGKLEKPRAPLPRPSPGVSFRVGEQLGELKWKISRREGIPDTLRVHLDDLTSRTVPEYLAHKYQLDVENCPDGGKPDDYDDALETSKMREKAENDLKKAEKRRKMYGMNVNGQSVVKPDEVCITVIGLDTKYDVETLFSAVYGIIPPLRAWRPRSSDPQWTVGNVQFFLVNGASRFYLRDQLVPEGIHLNKVSINYHGDLDVTAERVSVRYNWKHTQYKADVGASADFAFRTLPELAIELALDILTDEHTDALSGIFEPKDKTAATQYRVAFDAAMRRTLRAPSTSLTLYPCSKHDPKGALFRQLGLEPYEVSRQASEILAQSGAYPPIRDYARKALLAAPVASEAKGLDRLRSVLKMVFPKVESEAITIRVYDKLEPIAVWSEDKKSFAVALPKPCEEHVNAAVECFCWIIPVLEEAASTHVPMISTKKLWSAFALCMGGDLTPKTDTQPVPMDIDKPTPTAVATPARQSQSKGTTTAHTTTGKTITDSASRTSTTTAGTKKSAAQTKPVTATTTVSNTVAGQSAIRGGSTNGVTAAPASTSQRPTSHTTTSVSTPDRASGNTNGSSVVSPASQQTRQTTTNETESVSIADPSVVRASGTKTGASAAAQQTTSTATTSVSAANQYVLPPSGTTDGLTVMSPKPSPAAAATDDDEMLIARVTAAIREYSSLKKKHDVLGHEVETYRTAIAEKHEHIDKLNGQIAELQEENKSLLEEVGVYEQAAFSVRRLKADRPFKRQKTQQP